MLRDRHFDERRAAIFEAGKARALAGAPPKPEFASRELGSAEAMTFYDGYAKGCPGFLNPYRQNER